MNFNLGALHKRRVLRGGGRVVVKIGQKLVHVVFEWPPKAMKNDKRREAEIIKLEKCTDVVYG